MSNYGRQVWNCEPGVLGVMLQKTFEQLQSWSYVFFISTFFFEINLFGGGNVGPAHKRLFSQPQAFAWEVSAKLYPKPIAGAFVWR